MFKKRRLEPGVVHRGERFWKMNLTGIDVSGSSLEGCNFYKSDLSGANFAGANLVECSFNQANLTRANFAGAKLARATLCGALIDGVNFTKADLTSAAFNSSPPEHSNRFRTVADGDDYIPATIRKTLFTDANLKKASFGGALIEDVDFSTAHNLAFDRMKSARLKRVTGVPSQPVSAPRVENKAPTQLHANGLIDPVSDLRRIRAETGVDLNAARDAYEKSGWRVDLAVKQLGTLQSRVITERLREIDQLRNDGQLSDEEHAVLRRRILDI